MPERPTTTDIPVQWSAEETGSGVHHFDVQYKVDDGDWQPWSSYTDTIATEGVFSGALGHTYAFQVQATDHVSNAGAWVDAVSRPEL